MKRLSPLFSSALLVSGLLLLGSPAQAQAASPTPAGTEIKNQAVATFEPLEPGGISSSVSPVITTVVQALCSVSVQPDGTVASPGQRAAFRSGEGVVFRYTLVNTGNDTFNVPLFGRTEPGSAFAPGLRVVLDRNGNGTADADEPDVTNVRLETDERVNLLLVVQTVMGAQGDAFVNLVASCEGGEQDTNNVSAVSVTPPPALTVTKSFSPALVRPGDETTVTVTTRNEGGGESGEMILTDPLSGQLGQGMAYVPGSARASSGVTEYTADDVTWETAEPQAVRGLRVRVPSLAAGASLTLTFRMRATEAAENKVVTNVATAVTGPLSSSGTATVDVRYQPGVAIGPVGSPRAPENTPADTQTRTLAVVGQTICFDHTLENTGDVRDLFTVTVTYPQGGAKAVILGPDGQPLAQPVTFDPAATTPVQVCYEATQTGPLEGLVTVTGTRSTSNTTRDVVQNVEAGLPQLVKSVEPGPEKTLAVGDALTYTLKVHNPYARPLTNVVVSDPLPAHVDFVEASAGGTLSGEAGKQVVTWNVGTLGAGETRSFTVKAKVSPRAVDGEALTNIFNMVSAELPDPTPSNEVRNPVWNAALQITKTVSSAQVSPGDRLTYTLRLKNLSATTNIENAVVTDTPARGLSYLPGTTLLGGKAFADPEIRDGVLRWNIGTIPANGTVEIVYQTRVTAEATAQLVNSVQVIGDGAGGTVRAIASNVATAVTRLNLGVFAPLTDILGTVYVDRNRNGRFDRDLDTPVERARVILAGGRLALTDKVGRYHFANVPLGTQALRLDPNTTPYVPLSTAQDGGLPGTRTVHVRGLTTLDFPLAPVGADISATRRTTLTVGGVRVDKAVQRTAEGYVVTLKMNAPSSLTEVNLNDPLPTGAVLKEGRNTLSGTLNAGETTLTYRFEFSGAPDAAVTDPVLRWRN